MPQIAIPQYKAMSPVGVTFGQHSFNNVSSYSSPNSSLSPSRIVRNQDSNNLISPLRFHSQKPLLSITQSMFANAAAAAAVAAGDNPLQSKLYPSSLFDGSDTRSPHEEPLDLSFKTKPHTSGDSAADDSFNSFESEVLNLSQKSSRISQELDGKDGIPANVSLSMLQQQHDFDSANLRNVLLNNGKLVDDISEFSKVYGKFATENGSRRGRKRLFGPDSELNNSNDSNNNLLKMADFEPKTKRLSPNKETKLSNGLGLGDSPDQNQSEGLFTCDQCDKTFSKQSSLARHKYEHSGMTHLPLTPTTKTCLSSRSTPTQV